jgi:hypothetical protein
MAAADAVRAVASAMTWLPPSSATTNWTRGLPAHVVRGRFRHHQDIRRSPGQPRAIPPQRLLPALHVALIAPDTGGFWHSRGVRLIATDLHFSAGAGPEVQGRQRRC